MRISDWSSDVCSSDLRNSAGCRRCARSSACRGRSSACAARRSEEHTSELQSLMRISYAVFCLKKKTSTTPKLWICKYNQTTNKAKENHNTTIHHTNTETTDQQD